MAIMVAVVVGVIMAAVSLVVVAVLVFGIEQERILGGVVD